MQNQEMLKKQEMMKLAMMKKQQMESEIFKQSLSNMDIKTLMMKKKMMQQASWSIHLWEGARCSSVVRAFAHGAMGRRIDPSWGGPTELFLVPASAPRLV